MGSTTRNLGTGTVPRPSTKAACFLSDLTADTGLTMVVPGSHTTATHAAQVHLPGRGERPRRRSRWSSRDWRDL